MNAALELRPQFIVDAKGRKKAVVIPFDAYEKLMEDLADLAAAAEGRCGAAPRGRTQGFAPTK
ncbi:MAG: hypothetical protein CDV28_11417 [Candidatus Electronema aureum]|uniref:Antitoxin n=1 Tax=Candidatus Electronema aureum TaxID=2005002 RepID=A0A521G1P1_9BACT|nr:MAG: hypothetical protein CDV28_11417 [Candidatus Electronema aureum]